MKLRISDKLSLPADAVTQTGVVYGMKGQGKTVLLAVLCEELARCRHKFAYLDPIGPGYGLRFARDGRGKGLEILILGGRHGDIPIEPTGGAVVADLVVNHEVNTVIDISRRADGKMWTNGEKIRFVAEYCTRLYERQGELCFPMCQLIDEAGRFIPQDIPHGAVDIAKCVGAIEQLTELGRNVGVGMWLFTQRSARMKKSVSELAECMIAFRTIGPNSVGAIVDWLGEHVPRERHKEMIGQLRSNMVGHALVVSPGWLEFEGVVEMRMRETFDSSATPTADRKLVSAKPLGERDLAKYRELMAATIEKAKADDPRELKRQITELRKELAAKPTVAPAKSKNSHVPNESLKLLQAENRRLASALEKAMKFIVEISAYDFGPNATAEEIKSAVQAAVDRAMPQIQSKLEARSKDLGRFRKQCDALINSLKSARNEPVSINLNVRKVDPVQIRQTPAAGTAPEKNSDHVFEDGVLGRGGIEVLKAAAQYPEGVTDEQISVLTGYKKTSRTTYKQKLTAAGYAEKRGERLVATSAGISYLGNEYEPLPAGDALREHWLRRLSGGELELFKHYIEAYPEGIDFAALMERTQYQKTSVTTYRQKLRARRLIEGDRASENLFG